MGRVEFEFLCVILLVWLLVIRNYVVRGLGLVEVVKGNGLFLWKGFC